jgi:hypothetical protein
MLQEDRVVVIHQRREQSYQADSFTFQWEFLMQFDLEVRQLLNASITVTDISFGKNDNEALQKGFRKTIRSEFLFLLFINILNRLYGQNCC